MQATCDKPIGDPSEAKPVEGNSKAENAEIPKKPEDDAAQSAHEMLFPTVLIFFMLASLFMNTLRSIPYAPGRDEWVLVDKIATVIAIFCMILLLLVRKVYNNLSLAEKEMLQKMQTDAKLDKA